MDLRTRLTLVGAMCVVLGLAVAGHAQEASNGPVSTNYIVGPQDVLTITSYDQENLSGRFTVETDGTFTYPLIGRFHAGGLTLRQVEDSLKKRLTDEGYFKKPQLTVSVETYRSQRVFVIGEVRAPGAIPLSGSMRLVEVLARAGSTLPTAGAEAVIVHPADIASGPTFPTTADASIVRVDLRELQNGLRGQNPTLRDGDTIIVPRAESVYVFGQVRTPGAYALQQRNTTVLQALSLAGGITDRGSSGRIQIVRIIKGEEKRMNVKLTDTVQAGDTIVVRERFF